MKISQIEIILADEGRKFIFFIFSNLRVWTKTWASACGKQFQHFLVAWCLISSIKALSFTIEYISKICFFSSESSIDESTFCIICGFIRDSSCMTIALIKNRYKIGPNKSGTQIYGKTKYYTGWSEIKTETNSRRLQKKPYIN